MKKTEAISIFATSVRPREPKDRARYDEAVKMAIEALKSSERTAETAQKEACPVCGYKFQDCQCRFSGSAHPDRSKRAKVVADHIYLLTDAQIAHLAKVQEWWQISYDDEEMDRILEELKGNEKD